MQQIIPKRIKTIRKGDYELIHRINLDDMGFERDVFEMIKYNKGRKDIMPFFALPVVNNYSPSDPIKFTNQYTEKDYQQMFRENKKKLIIALKNFNKK